MKNDVNVASKSNKQKNLAESEAGSVSQRYGSADLDPYHNVKDPQHCYKWARCSEVVLVDEMEPSWGIVHKSMPKLAAKYWGKNIK